MQENHWGSWGDHQLGILVATGGALRDSEAFSMHVRTSLSLHLRVYCKPETFSTRRLKLHWHMDLARGGSFNKIDRLGPIYAIHSVRQHQYVSKLGHGVGSLGGGGGGRGCRVGFHKRQAEVEEKMEDDDFQKGWECEGSKLQSFRA